MNGVAGHVHTFLFDLNGVREDRVSVMLSDADCLTAQVVPPRAGEFVIVRDESNELYPARVEAVGRRHARLVLL